MRIRSRRIRRWTRRLVKWGLVTVVLLTIANWTIAYLKIRDGYPISRRR